MGFNGLSFSPVAYGSGELVLPLKDLDSQLPGFKCLTKPSKWHFNRRPCAIYDIDRANSQVVVLVI